MNRKYYQLPDLFAIFLLCITFILAVETELGEYVPVVRLFVSIPILFYYPGFLLVLVIFNKKVPLNGFEHFGLSLVLSMSILVFEFLLLDWVGISISQDSFTIVHMIFYCPLLLTVLIQRNRNAHVDEFTTSQVGKHWVIYAMVAIVVIASFSYSLWINPTNEKFTELSLLSVSDNTNLPLVETKGSIYKIKVVVANVEQKNTDYTLKLFYDDRIQSFELPSLADGEIWSNIFGITFDSDINIHRVDVQLFKPDIDAPYRKVHLWVIDSPP